MPHKTVNEVSAELEAFKNQSEASSVALEKAMQGLQQSMEKLAGTFDTVQRATEDRIGRIEQRVDQAFEQMTETSQSVDKNCKKIGEVLRYMQQLPPPSPAPAPSNLGRQDAANGIGKEAANQNQEEDGQDQKNPPPVMGSVMDLVDQRNEEFDAWWQKQDDRRRSRGVPDDVNRTCKIVATLPKFTGKGSWEGFYNTFLKIVSKCNVEEAEKLEMLQICLLDHASRFESSLPKAVRSDYGMFIERLQARYGEDQDETTARISLHAAKQFSTETEDEFAERLERLAEIAYQDGDQHTKDGIIVHQFIRGCINQKAAFVVSTQKPPNKNLAQVLSSYKAAVSRQTAIFGATESTARRMKTEEFEVRRGSYGEDRGRRFGRDDRSFRSRGYSRDDSRGDYRSSWRRDSRYDRSRDRYGSSERGWRREPSRESYQDRRRTYQDRRGSYQDRRDDRRDDHRDSRYGRSLSRDDSRERSEGRRDHREGRRDNREHWSGRSRRYEGQSYTRGRDDSRGRDSSGNRDDGRNYQGRSYNRDYSRDRYQSRRFRERRDSSGGRYSSGDRRQDRDTKTKDRSQKSNDATSEKDDVSKNE